MATDARLREFLPDTSLFTPDQLWKYTDKYPVVMLKPSGGGGGAGIIQVKKLGKDVYQVHAGSDKRVIAGKDQTLAHVRALFRPKPYVLQPRIPLGTINGRPFDVRVMVQRKEGTPWRVTGWLAKVAGPGFVVTNIRRSRGQVIPIYTALQLSKVPATPELFTLIQKIALIVAYRLGKAYPELRMIGLDMGIDMYGKPWIIEANFRPALSLFRKLRDQTYFRRIASYLR